MSNQDVTILLLSYELVALVLLLIFIAVMIQDPPDLDMGIIVIVGSLIWPISIIILAAGGTGWGIHKTIQRRELLRRKLIGRYWTLRAKLEGEEDEPARLR